ncbi:6TM ABC transporter family protein [Kineococcus sp. SYSU DK001]|uniref:hypothetical protein n=1 Tax=Kineococcus sp. SYSU DK001 TaxID=3383122 RepID=UPI003D7D43AE
MGSGRSLAPSVALLPALLVGDSGLGFVQWILLGGPAEHVVPGARTSLVRRSFAAQVPALQRHSTGGARSWSRRCATRCCCS